MTLHRLSNWVEWAKLKMIKQRRHQMGLDVRPQDDAGFWYNPERIDPRAAMSTSELEFMIELRREAGLPDWPEHPLYPDFPVYFEPDEIARLAL